MSDGIRNMFMLFGAIFAYGFHASKLFGRKCNKKNGFSKINCKFAT